MEKAVYVLLALGAVAGLAWLVSRDSQGCTGPTALLCKAAGGSDAECCAAKSVVEGLTNGVGSLTIPIVKKGAGPLTKVFGALGIKNKSWRCPDGTPWPELGKSAQRRCVDGGVNMFQIIWGHKDARDCMCVGHEGTA